MVDASDIVEREGMGEAAMDSNGVAGVGVKDFDEGWELMAKCGKVSSTASKPPKIQFTSSCNHLQKKEIIPKYVFFH